MCVKPVIPRRVCATIASDRVVAKDLFTAHLVAFAISSYTVFLNTGKKTAED